MKKKYYSQSYSLSQTGGADVTHKQIISFKLPKFSLHYNMARYFNCCISRSRYLKSLPLSN